MGKTRDLFNKIRDTKGTIHTKMGTAKSSILPSLYNFLSKRLFLNPVSGDSSDFVLWKIANDFLLVKYNGIFHYLPRPPPDSGGSSRNTANRHFHFFISIL